MSNTIADKILQLSEKMGALQYGDFTLSSGAKSTYYFDGRIISLNPEGAYWLGEAFLEAIKGTDIVAVGGPATAAIPIVTAISLVSYIKGSPINSFFVRPETKGHGTNKQIEGSIKPGSKVMILDDVCTSGGSIFTAIGAVEAENCTVERVMAVLDRLQGGSDEIRRRGYAFSSILVPDPTGKIRVSSK